MSTYRRFKTSCRVLIAGFVLLLAISPSVLAEINAENVTGTITITTPAGEVVTVEPGQPLPAIQSGSTIEVITGTAEIKATGGDTVNVLVNESTVTLTAGSEIAVTISPTGDATLDVISGVVTVVNADGTTETLTAGESIAAPALAPAAPSDIPVPGEGPDDLGPQQKGYST